MTGSIFPCAPLRQVLPYFSSVWYFPRGSDSHAAATSHLFRRRLHQLVARHAELLQAAPRQTLALVKGEKINGSALTTRFFSFAIFFSAPSSTLAARAETQSTFAPLTRGNFC